LGLTPELLLKALVVLHTKLEEAYTFRRDACECAFAFNAF